MRWLVTGATGFLGSHVSEHLGSSGHDVTALARAQSGAFPSIIADIRQPFDLNGESFDAVVHCAGKAHVVPATAEEHQSFFDINEHGTHRLLGALDQAGGPPKFFVLISTIAVYGRAEGELLAESTETNPDTPYGQSKLAAEDLVAKWCSRNNCIATILRLPLISGPGAPGNLRAMVNAIEKGRYLGIGAGDAQRSVVRAADVASAIPEIMRIGGTYHLTDGHHPSLRELEKAICAASSRSLPRRIPLGVARAAGLVGDMVHKVSGVRLPIDSERVSKLTKTYTVSDQSVRHQITWAPGRVIDNVQELLA